MSGVFNWGMAALHGREYRGGTGTRDLNLQPRDGTNVVYILKKRNHCTVPSGSDRILQYIKPHGLAVPHDIPDYKESSTSVFTEEYLSMSVAGIVNPSAFDSTSECRGRLWESPLPSEGALALAAG